MSPKSPATVAEAREGSPEAPPRVSIAIPVHNREVLIRRSIESVLSQTERDFELIVADNCSTDSTWEVVRGYARRDRRVRAFRNESNVGPVRNWQLALSKARGEYFKFLWSDDWLAPDYLQKTLEPLIGHPEIAFSFCLTKIVSDAATLHVYAARTGSAVMPAREFYYGSSFWGTCPLSPGSALFRRADVEESLVLHVKNRAGLDFTRYGAGNDLLMLFLPLVTKKTVAYVHDTEAFFYSHTGSFSASNDLTSYYDLARALFCELCGDRVYAARLYLEREGRLDPQGEVMERLLKASSRPYMRFARARKGLKAGVKQFLGSRTRFLSAAKAQVRRLARFLLLR